MKEKIESNQRQKTFTVRNKGDCTFLLRNSELGNKAKAPSSSPVHCPSPSLPPTILPLLPLLSYSEQVGISVRIGASSPTEAR